MIRWIKEATAVVLEALGHYRFLLPSTIGAAIGATDWLKPHLTRFSAMEEVIGIPSWVVGVLVFFLISAFQVLNYAIKLRRKITPNIQISFDPEGSIVETEQEIRSSQGPSRMCNARYVRGLVTTQAEVAVMDCSVYLTEVSQRTSSGAFERTKFLDGAPLLWATSESQYNVKIAKGIRRYFDILHVNDDTNSLQLAMNATPFRLVDLFKMPGTFRLKVIAVADGAQAEAIFEFTKGDNWNDISGRQV